MLRVLFWTCLYFVSLGLLDIEVKYVWEVWCAQTTIDMGDES